MSHCCGSIRSSGASAGQTGAPGSGLPPGVLDGDLLVWDDALQLWVPTQPIGSQALQLFGAIGVLTGTSYLFPVGGDNVNTVSAANSFSLPIPFDCTIDRIHALHNSPTGATDVTYTIEVNTVASAVSIVLNSGASQGSNLTDSIAVLSGDKVRLQAVHALGSTISNLRVVIAIRLLS